MNAMEAIMTRRSTRKMSPEMPPLELIRQVVEAGRAAPSGSNNQSTRFIVITKQTVLRELSELVRRELAAKKVGPHAYISLRRCISAAQKTDYVFHYNAPVLIVTANKASYGNGMADSACALENMMIAANALELGSCWINQLHWLTDHEPVRNYLYPLGLAEDETITGGLILGYGADGHPVRDPLERTGNPVEWICD